MDRTVNMAHAAHMSLLSQRSFSFCYRWVTPYLRQIPSDVAIRLITS